MNQHRESEAQVNQEGPEGVCALCRGRRVLRDSHLLPAALYKILRDPDRRNPNPVMVTPAWAGATSRQLRAYLLCEECEQRFSEQGERYVLSQCARRDRFPLRELLQGSTLALAAVSQEIQLYDVGGLITQQHIDEYLYFAASIFWRASARKWGSTIRQFSLGAKYEEQFRLYLLGEAEWPQNARLAVHVSSDERVDFTIDPVSLRMEAVRRYKFYIPGILFVLFVGATVPHDPGHLCTLNGSARRFMVLCPFKNDSLYQGLEMVAREAMRNPRTLRPAGAGGRGASGL